MRSARSRSVNRYTHRLSRGARWIVTAVSLLGPFARGLEPVPEELPRSRPLSPVEALQTFQLAEGLEIKAVATEPLVMDPVAMDFAIDGSLFVIEMRGYSENRDAGLGRIRKLEDLDQDGVFDRATLFADGLRWPTAVICANGGLYVGATPDIIFLVDGDGDGRSDSRRVVFTGFGPQQGRLNVQGMINSFRWTPDHRIHGSASSSGGRVHSALEPDKPPVDLTRKDFSFALDGTDFRAETGGSQHGMSFGLWGRKFLCHNSDHFQTTLYHADYAQRVAPATLPRAVVSIGVEGPAAEVFRISPEEPWRVVRTRWRVAGSVGGPIEGGGRVSGYFTSATGVTIFGGDALGPDYIGAGFVGDVGSNLVHRKQLSLDTVPPQAARPLTEQGREFLASTDTWFRPVQFGEGPDGSLYILDMYRETIEHPWSLPESIKSHLELNSGNDRGRIYRIHRKNAPQNPPMTLVDAPPEALLAALSHPNRWRRQTASRRLLDFPDARTELRALAGSAESAWARFHALHTLAAVGELDDATLAARLQDPDPEIRRNAVTLCMRSHPGPLTRAALRTRVSDPHIPTRFEVAKAAAGLPMEERAPLIHALARSDANHPWFRTVLRASGHSVSWELLALALKTEDDSMAQWRRDCVRSVSRDQESASQAIDAILEHPGDHDALALAHASVDALVSQTGNPPSPSLQSKLQTVWEHATSASARVEPTPESIATFLRWLPNRASVHRLGALLSEGPTQAIRQAAGDSLVALGNVDALSALFRNLEAFDESTVSRWLAQCCIRPAGRRAVMDAIDQGWLAPTQLMPDEADSLRQAPEADIRTRALAIWATPTPADRQSIVERFFPALRLQGEGANGRALYQSRCALCHRWRDQGVHLGPDLASVKNTPKDALLVAILDPSREAQPKYYRADVALKNGQRLSGLLETSSPEALTILFPGGSRQTVPRTNVAEVGLSTQSIMPAGLEIGWSHQDMADLLAFLTQ